MIYDYKQDPELSRNGNVYSFDDYLEHHGIAGQKWGVRHGPPYPLVNAAKTIHYNVGKMTDKTKEAYRQHKERRQASQAQKQAVKIQKKEEADANRAQAKEQKAKRDTNIAEAGPKKFVKSKQRISDMSSEELQARINRLKLEQEYRKYLNGGVEQRQKTGNGKATLDSILNAAGNSTLKKVGDELFVGIAKMAVATAQTSLKYKADRRNENAKRRAEILAEERKERREMANASKERHRKIQEIQDKSYNEAYSKLKAADDFKKERDAELKAEQEEERRRRAAATSRTYRTAADANRYSSSRSRYASSVNLGRSVMDAVVSEASSAYSPTSYSDLWNF